jgi:hypothetical protein
MIALQVTMVLAPRRRRNIALAIGAIGILANAVPASAQPRRWEVEGAIGVAAGALSSGSSVLPAPGPPIATSSPLFPSRQTSSWLFGDGAQLLNSVNTAFGLSQQVQPLDSALQSLGLDATGLAVSFRARRTLTRRFSLEFSLDLLAESAHLSDTLVSAASASRDSVKSAMTALLSTGPFANAVVDATSATGNGTSRGIATTGALVWQFRSGSAWAPYATFGGGVLGGSGDLPSVTVQDTYRLSILGSVPIAETDRVTLHYEHDNALIGVIGGGLRHDVSDGWGWRVDGRVFVGGRSPRLLLDAAPSVTTGSPAGFIESFTNPSVQFSNNASTGRQSTLSGAPIQGFEAVSGGRETRVLVTFGFFRRF